MGGGAIFQMQKTHSKGEIIHSTNPTHPPLMSHHSLRFSYYTGPCISFPPTQCLCLSLCLLTVCCTITLLCLLLSFPIQLTGDAALTELCSLDKDCPSPSGILFKTAFQSHKSPEWQSCGLGWGFLQSGSIFIYWTSQLGKHLSHWVQHALTAR